MMRGGKDACGGTIGLIFMALSAVAFSVMTLLVHILSTRENFPSFQQVWMRGVQGFLLCAFWLRRVPNSDKRPYLGNNKTRPILLARGIIGAFATSCNWFILTQLPLGEATVIVFTAPILTVLCARVFLKESVSWCQSGLILISSGGVLLIARPRFLGFEDSNDDEEVHRVFSRELTIFIGLLGALGGAIINVLVRKLSDVHSVVVVAWLMVFGVGAGAPLSFALQSPVWPRSLMAWFMIASIGALGFVAQILKTQGLKWEEAGIGSMMRNLDLVFAFSFQATILSETIHPLSLVGALLTLTSSLLMGYQKHRDKRAKANYALVETNNNEDTETGVVMVTTPEVMQGTSDDDYNDFLTEISANPFSYSEIATPEVMEGISDDDCNDLITDATDIISEVYNWKSVSWCQSGLILISSGGVLLIARPRFLGFEESDDDEAIHRVFSRELTIFIGLLGALGSAFTNILVRKLSDVHSAVVVAWLMVFGFSVGVPLSFALQSPVWPRSLMAWFMIASIGALGFVAQILKTQGLKWEKAGIGSMMRNLDLVFAFSFQATILSETIHPLSLVGALLTLTSSMSMGYLKLRETRAKARYTLVETSNSMDTETGVAMVAKHPSTPEEVKGETSERELPDDDDDFLSEISANPFSYEYSEAQ
eukprot:g51.t1